MEKPESTPCIFCDIISGVSQASFVYRDDLVTAFMDIRPVNPGHVLVIPNAHASHLADLPAETGGWMFQAAQQVAGALRKSGLRCEGVDLFLADGEAAGQEIFHVHLHVFPRYRGDGFGFRFNQAYWRQSNREKLDEIAGLIRESLNKRKF